MIDGAEQSEIWGVFRVACRARPLYAKMQQEPGYFVDGCDVAMLHVEPDVNVAITTTDRYPEFGRTEQGRSVILRTEGALPLRLSYRIERIDSK